QQIIAEETGVKNTIDPLGGSYYLETLTNKMEEEVYEYFKKLDAMGGMVEAIKRGFPQQEIRKSALIYQKEIDEKKRILVGVNDFFDKKRVAIPALKLNPAGEKDQLERLHRIKQTREDRKIRNSLDKLKSGAAKGEYLMPLLIEAVSCYATVGEISLALKEVYGGYDEPGERAHAASRNSKKILLCKIGQDGHDRGVMVLKDFLSERGFDTIYSGLRKDPEGVVDKAVKEDVSVIGVSMLSGAHRTWFPRVVSLLKKRGRGSTVVVGGGIIPEKDVSFLEKSGVKKIFPPGSPLDVISGYLEALEPSVASGKK
ncbi:MAG: methylmalonyl-CoA mutase family protein, partial [Nitrospinota bacterium]